MTALQDMIEQDYGLTGRGKWYHANDHDSLVYNAEEDYFFWNSQNLKGNALDYLIKVRGMKEDDARNFLNNFFGAFKENTETPTRSTPYDRLVDIMWANGVKDRNYWYKRCLKDETIDRYKLGYYNGWNLIPIYNNGDFVNFQKRRDEPTKSMHYWYRSGEVYLYNEGILPFVKNTIYITEGLVDCILLNQEGLTSVSATGVNTWRQEWFSKFSKVKEIIYFADNDKAGLIGASSVAHSLGTYKVKIVTFDGKFEKYDTGDFFREYQSKDALLDWISGHSHYIFELENSFSKAKNIRKLKRNLAWAR